MWILDYLEAALAKRQPSNTGTVLSTTASGYHAGGWRSFSNAAELLPGTYTFSFSDGPNASVADTAGAVNDLDL